MPRLASLEMGLDGVQCLRRFQVQQVTLMGIDWDKGQRRERVIRHGGEPSEYRPDLTEQIATAKGRSKIRGHMVSKRGEHVELIRCPFCPSNAPKVYKDVYLSHLDRHDLDRRLKTKSKPTKTRCPYPECGKSMRSVDFPAHLIGEHSKWDRVLKRAVLKPLNP